MKKMNKHLHQLNLLSNNSSSCSNVSSTTSQKFSSKSTNNTSSSASSVDKSHVSVSSVSNKKFNHKQYQKALKQTKKVRKSARNKVEQWKSDNNTKSVPFSTYAKSMLDAGYHFIQLPGLGSIGAPLLLYIGNPKDKLYFGTYTASKVKIEQEISLLFPEFSDNSYTNFIMYLRARVPITPRNNPREKNKVPLENGIYNMGTHSLENFSPKYHFENKIMTPYVSNPPEPNINGWTVNGFVNEALGKRQAKMFWQMMFNVINCNYPSNVMYWLKGDSKGSNGKSTIEQLIKDLVGSNNVATTLITEFSGSFGLSTLPGTIVDIGDNVNSNAHIRGRASDNLHSIISGDLVEINQKYMQPYAFQYKGTLIMSSNGFPSFDDNNGMKRRLIVMVMTHHFPKNNNSVKFDYLSRKDVREYILYKAIHSAPKNNKLYVSSESRHALSELLNSSDSVREFAKKVFLSWQIDRIPTMTVYQYYLKWADAHGYDSRISSRVFTNRFSNYVRKDYNKKPEKISQKVCNDWDSVMTRTGILISYQYRPKVNSIRRCFCRK